MAAAHHDELKIFSCGSGEGHVVSNIDVAMEN
jgi:hypothetical protein